MKIFKYFLILTFILLSTLSCTKDDEGVDIWDAIEEVANIDIKFTGWTEYDYTHYTFFNPPAWIQGFWFVESYNGIQLGELLNPSMDDFNLTFTSNNVLIFDGDLNRKLNRVNGTYKLIEETITTTSYKIVIEWTKPYIKPKRQILQLTYVSETEILFKWDKGFIDNWGDRERSEEGTLYTIKDVDENHMTYIPDDNFEQALIAKGYDDVLNDSVLTNNIIRVEELELEYVGISDLTGIEAFKLLTQLNCRDNQITHLDLSQNKNLGVLDCSLNNITELDLSSNSLLLELKVQYNELTNLNVSQITNLEVLWCLQNQLIALNISNNTSLNELYCVDNPLTCIQVNQNQLDNIPNHWWKDTSATYSLNCN